MNIIKKTLFIAIYIIFFIALQPNVDLCLHNGPPPNQGHISGFLTSRFLQSGVVNPTPNPQPVGPVPIFITPGPSYTPGTGYPFVAFYNMHGLQWDDSLILVTIRENIYYLLHCTTAQCGSLPP